MTTSSSLPPSSPTHYQVLGISAAVLASQTEPGPFLKRAYRRALLRHHPDKASSSSSNPAAADTPSNNNSNSNPKTKTEGFTIDQISLAFTTLSSPSQRLAYDALLRKQHLTTNPTTGNSPSESQKTGIETVDLDDLAYSPTSSSSPSGEDDEDGYGQWYRSCRCGNPRGYLVTAADLEEAAACGEGEGGGAGAGGELMVECADCSLWLRVCFAVLSEDEGGEGEGNGGGRDGEDGDGDSAVLRPFLDKRN